jgi:hypothetical protein
MDVLIFTCEGREHLLSRTWGSFNGSLPRSESRVIMAIDGNVDRNIIRQIAPDIVIQRIRRRGYIISILQSIRLVDSEFFFWLEDDWELREAINIQNVTSWLAENPKFIQVRLSKVAPLDERDADLGAGMRASSVGYSANPSVCRTSLIREAFEHVQTAAPGNTLGQDGFEDVISRWAEARQLKCAVMDPGSEQMVKHLGDLESTGRSWHMTASLTEPPKEYGFLGSSPPQWRRFWMLAKLVRAFGWIGWTQLWRNPEYDLAFRIVAAIKLRGTQR